MLNLTVKHMADDGRERIIPCAEARYDPKEKKVRLDGLDSGYPVGELSNGLVFVMNATGATVAHYNLLPAETDRPIPPPPADTDTVLHA